MSTLIRALCLVGVLAWPSTLVAQEFPNRTVKFVVPFPAGGPADTISRILTEKMAAMLGQAIVIENRAGAGGLTGIASVAKAEPDGYTIAIAPSSGLAMNVNLRENMPFHPLKDLALITQIVSVPEILVVNESVPVKTRGRAHRHGESAARQAGVRLDRPRRHAASGHGAAEAHGPDRLGARALHRRSTSRERPARRPCSADVCRCSGAARQCAVGQAARAGGRQPETRSEPAVGSDDGRARHAPGGSRQLVRPRGPHRHAAGGRCQASLRRRPKLSTPPRSRTSSPRTAPSRSAIPPTSSRPT